MSDGKKSGLRSFSPETAPRYGRVAGSRNKLNAQFLDDLREIWEQHGKSALKTVALEQPAALVKVMASILPKEFEISEFRLQDLSDEQLEAITAILRRSIGGARSTGDREKTPVH